MGTMGMYEGAGTAVVLDAARYHVGALARRRETAPLAPPVRTEIRNLKAARDRAEEAMADASEKFGGLVCADFDVDDRIRLLDLDVLKRVRKNRADRLYKIVFPKGLAKVLALRGEEEERQVKAILRVLRAEAADLATAYADLGTLAAEATAAEAAWLAAQTAASRLFGEEVIARGILVRRLQKNEGALIALFPGQKARVRTFFKRPKRSSKKAAPA